MSIDWVIYVPIIAQWVSPTALETISRILKLTEESEKERLLQTLRDVSDEVYKLSNQIDEKYKEEIKEKINELIEELNSQESQQTLRPNVAEAIMLSLQHAGDAKKSEAVKILKELRKILNTWVHDVEFGEQLPKKKP